MLQPSIAEWLTRESSGHNVNMGRASLLLKNAGQSDKAKEMCNRVMSCDSYHKALNVISEYVETELTPKTRNKPNRGDAR